MGKTMSGLSGKDNLRARFDCDKAGAAGGRAAAKASRDGEWALCYLRSEVASERMPVIQRILAHLGLAGVWDGPPPPAALARRSVLLSRLPLAPGGADDLALPRIASSSA
jgi:hypothetical protein